MQKVLILFVHPRFEKSRVNKELIKHIPHRDNITFHDLYEHYPNFNIDVAKEKELLLAHDIIIWHHPLYWYSAPPLLKQWIDMVLEFEWAYGPGGSALKGKVVFNCITTGGARETYHRNRHHNFEIKELLRPFEQTANICGMVYLPPFAVQGSYKLENTQKFSGDKLDYLQLKKLELLNDICKV